MMRKGNVVEYIMQFEKGVKYVLRDNPLKDMLVFEIINGSLVYVHDLDASNFTDDVTARNITQLVIKSLFTKEKLMRAFTKHVNCYNTLGLNHHSLIHNIDGDLNYVKKLSENKKELEDISKLLCSHVVNYKFRINNKPRKKQMILAACGIIGFLLTVSFAFFLFARGMTQKVGQYVYIDAIGVVHVDRKCCFSSNNNKTKEERLLAKKGVEFVDTTDFHGCAYDNNYGYWYVEKEYDYCPRCITDETYTHLHRILTSNRGKLNSQNDEQHRSK